jgi:hypothetical protein
LLNAGLSQPKKLLTRLIRRRAHGWLMAEAWNPPFDCVVRFILADRVGQIGSLPPRLRRGRDDRRRTSIPGKRTAIDDRDIDGFLWT